MRALSVINSSLLVFATVVSVACAAGSSDAYSRGDGGALGEAGVEAGSSDAPASPGADATRGPPQIGDVCSVDADCDAGSQLCAILPASLGFCSSRCTSDLDCPAFESVATSCDTSFGVCRLDCAGGGSGDGECPPSMTCIAVEISPGVNGYGCQYPESGPIPVAVLPDAGAPAPTPTGAQYAGCEQDSDCQVGSCVELANGKICSTTCTQASECASASSGSAIPYCADLAGFDACALSCPTGTQCPAGAECVDATCLPQGALYIPCSGDADCGPSTSCDGTHQFCTKACSADSDCPGPPTGDSTAVCGGDGRCVLPCETTTCPSDLSCIEHGGGLIRQGDFFCGQ